MNGNQLSIGRNHSTADRASLTDFGDCFRVNLDWDDGANVYVLYDTKDDAVQHLARLGFYKD
jgi:hypothetical protein